NPMNLAARMGRWSASHRKIAIFGWLGLVVALFALGTAIGTKKLDWNDTGAGETARAQSILKRAGFTQPAGETVLVTGSGLTATDPVFRRAVGDVVDAVSAVEVVRNVRSPYAAGNGGQISEDGRSAIVQFKIRGKLDDSTDRIDPVLDAIAG